LRWKGIRAPLNCSCRISGPFQLHGVAMLGFLRVVLERNSGGALNCVCRISVPFQLQGSRCWGSCELFWKGIRGPFELHLPDFGAVPIAGVAMLGFLWVALERNSGPFDLPLPDSGPFQLQGSRCWGSCELLWNGIRGPVELHLPDFGAVSIAGVAMLGFL